MIQLTTELFCSRGLSNELLDTLKKLLQSRHTACNLFEDNRTSHQFSTKQDLIQYIAQNNSCERENGSVWGASAPLHEIDFSRCKHATPSYRALPTSMSRPRCGERSGLDLVVLNDTWVSQPVGTEGTYSFKHVKKNQYEEELFRCEDKRFELDVVIDSNAAAVAVLELINAEVQQNEHSTTLSISMLKEVSSGRNNISAGGEVINIIAFMLDATALSTAHVNAILRAYGEHGAN
jgi:paired amphipathic helix protein Sin3a